MSDGTMDIKTVHEENRRRIVIHDVKYIVDKDGEKLIDVDSAVEQYDEGNWEYIDEEEG